MTKPLETGALIHPDITEFRPDQRTFFAFGFLKAKTCSEVSPGSKVKLFYEYEGQVHAAVVIYLGCEGDRRVTHVPEVFAFEENGIALEKEAINIHARVPKIRKGDHLMMWQGNKWHEVISAVNPIQSNMHQNSITVRQAEDPKEKTFSIPEQQLYLKNSQAKIGQEYDFTIMDGTDRRRSRDFKGRIIKNDEQVVVVEREYIYSVDPKNDSLDQILTPEIEVHPFHHYGVLGSNDFYPHEQVIVLQISGDEALVQSFSRPEITRTIPLAQLVESSCDIIVTRPKTTVALLAGQTFFSKDPENAESPLLSRHFDQGTIFEIFGSHNNFLTARPSISGEEHSETFFLDPALVYFPETKVV